MTNRRIILAALIAACHFFTVTPPSQALDIPTLTWERGKTHDVVLGGYAENLNWNLSLINSSNRSSMKIDFERSRSNSSNFLIYKVAIPRDLPIGEFFLVAKSETEAESLVAAVQVVDRFQYQILEIPRDLLFILFGLIFSLSMQLTLRAWPRYNYLSWQVDLNAPKSLRNSLITGMRSQRQRWQERWIGVDTHLEGRGELGTVLESLFPFIALLFGTYAGIQESFKTIDGGSTVFISALLAVIAFLDPYSGKLIVISYSSIFVLFNDLMNFPALLNLALIMAFFLVPRYVSDLAREFARRELPFISLKRTSQFQLLFSSFTAGLSVFWLYLVSESVILSGETDATRVIPMAVGVALANLYLEGNRSAGQTEELIRPTDRVLVISPIIKWPTTLILLAVSTGVIYVWTDNLLVSLLITMLTFGTLLSTYFSPNRAYQVRGKLLRYPLFVVLSVASLSILITFMVSRAPEVTRDRSLQTLIFGSLPIFLYSTWTLYFSKSKPFRILRGSRGTLLAREKGEVET